MTAVDTAYMVPRTDRSGTCDLIVRSRSTRSRTMQRRGVQLRRVFAACAVGAVVASVALVASPAGASTTGITTITGNAGATPAPIVPSTGSPDAGAPVSASLAQLDPTAVAYDAANGNIAVASTVAAPAVSAGTYVYLIVGADNTTEPATDYGIAANLPAGSPADLIPGDVYLLAGDGSVGLYGDPGAGVGNEQSASAVATQNPIVPTSLAFDANGNLLLNGQAPTGAVANAGYAAIQLVPQTTTTTTEYNITSLTAGDLYTIADSGLDGSPSTAVSEGTSDVQGYSTAIDSHGNIVTSGNNGIYYVNFGSSVSVYGKTIPTKHTTNFDPAGVAGDCTAGSTGAAISGFEFFEPRLSLDASNNLYITDAGNSGASGFGCTDVVAASASAIPGVSGTPTVGDLYVLAGGGSSTADDVAATSADLDSTGSVSVAIDPAGNLVLGVSGTSGTVSPAVRIVAESSTPDYGITAADWTVGDIYTVAGGPSNVLQALAGPTSLASNGAGDLYLTDGTTTSNLYEVTGGPTGAAPVATPTTTSNVSVSPSSPTTAGTEETLTATVSPSSAAGSVVFLNGSTALAAASTVTSGLATLNITLPQGSYSLTASFTPTTPAAYDASVSPSAVTYTVNAAATPADGETITENVAATGVFTLTVPANAAVTLSSPTLLAGSTTTLDSTGSLQDVTVTDTHNTTPGWTVSGQDTDFLSGSNTLSGNDLGWTPSIVSQTTGQGATEGTAVAAGDPTGLKSVQPWATAPSGSGYGTAVLGAGLDLQIPASTPPGTYTSTLTVTAIEAP
jgi:hypothetical protein